MANLLLTCAGKSRYLDRLDLRLRLHLPLMDRQQVRELDVVGVSCVAT